MAFCKYCGSSVPDKAEFCPECGKKAPGGNRSASPFTAQESFTREPLSRKEFCDTSFSPDVKKRVRANWIALSMGVSLRVAAIPVNAFLMMPGSMRSQYMGYAFSGLIFSATGLCILMLLLACATKHWGFAATAVVLGVYKLLSIHLISLIIGHGVLVASTVIVLVNTRKLEKQYQTFLDHAFPGRPKK